jgi:type IV secretory pathway VirB4 component
MPDHNTPSQTALTALEEAVLFSLKLDKEILEKYSAPRKQLYKEHLYQIFQQEQDKKLKKESTFVFTFMIAEPYTRSQIKDALNTSKTNEEVVRKLAPFHRDIKALLEEVRQEIFSFSEPMLEIVAKEKGIYQQLLEELTELIRQHLLDTNPLNAAPQTAFSPIRKVVEQAQEKIAEKELLRPKADKVLVTIASEDFQRVMAAFLPYVAPEQEEALSAFLLQATAQKLFTSKAIISSWEISFAA